MKYDIQYHERLYYPSFDFEVKCLVFSRNKVAQKIIIIFLELRRRIT